MKFRLQPQKKNSITKKNSVSFTNRRWPTPNYNVCCVTRQYFFTIHFFASQRLPEGPACLYNYIYLLLSSFFFQIQVVRRSLSLSIKMIYNQVLRDKRKSPHCFDQRISRAFPGNLHKTFKTIFGCPNWKKEWTKISSTKHNKKIDIYIFGFVSLRPKLRNTMACIQTPPLPPPPLSESTDLLLLNIPCLFPL